MSADCVYFLKGQVARSASDIPVLKFGTRYVPLPVRLGEIVTNNRTCEAHGQERPPARVGFQQYASKEWQQGNFQQGKEDG